MGQTQMNDNENSKSTCQTCKYSMWLVGIGQGMRCKHPENMLPDNVPILLPSRHFNCSHYEADDDDAREGDAN